MYGHIPKDLHFNEIYGHSASEQIGVQLFIRYWRILRAFVRIKGIVDWSLTEKYGEVLILLTADASSLTVKRRSFDCQHWKQVDPKVDFRAVVTMEDDIPVIYIPTVNGQPALTIVRQ